MRRLHKRLSLTGVLGVGVLFAGIASAMPVTMNFDGIATSEQVADYYNGGQASILGLIPDGPNGPDYGVVWSGAVATDGNGSTPTPPSSPNFMAYADGVSATMNVAAGFGGSGFSFAYYGGGPTVTIHSGLDGSGSLLASETLDSSLCGISFCWQSFAFPDFSGTAKSVVFGGTGVFDDITFDMTPNAVPEPAEFGIFGFGVLLVGLFAGMRRRMP
ncbi:MAG TPA: hypothetical protein VF284_05265 [Rhodanobacteraceae bacterium]